MNVYYDNIVFHLQRAGGISTYWAELITRALRDKLKIKFIDGPNNNINTINLKIIDENVVQGIGSPIIAKRFINPRLNHEVNPFIFHSSYNRVCKNSKAINIITIHDFIHEKFYRGVRKFLHSSQKGKSLMLADKIIAVSENTKKDLLNIYPQVDSTRVKVIYNGVSEDFFLIEEKKELNGRPYMVFIGSREHYKNFEFAVNLIKEIQDFDFYIVGSVLKRKEEYLLSKNIPGRFKVFTNISNHQLNMLYNGALALLYPSSYEGFGIPLLEAMKTGLPFIALNKSSIPEVAGDAGELIDELDIDAFKQAVNHIADNRNSYVLKGLERSRLFSWEKCYQDTLALYNKLG